jgi:DNA-binding beta-propeller fold protein YncE
VLVFVVAAANGAPTARAAELVPGDVVVADPDAGGVFRVDLEIGSVTEISVGGDLLYPSGVAVDAAGNAYVADPDANAILQVDPSDGSQSLVCAGAPLRHPTGVAVAPGGKILVADPDARAIFELTLGSCAAEVAISGPPLLFPTGVRVEPGGDILVADPDANAIFRFSDGSPPEVVTEGDLLLSPRAVAPDQDDLLVADPVSRGVIRVAGGVQTLETGLDALPFPTGLDVVTVPEPGELVLRAGALGALALLHRRRRRG